MSKSLDNYIALTDSPKEIFGKVMSIPDNVITRYMQYGAFYSNSEVKEAEKGLADGSIHPRNAKVETAKKIVELYHSKEAADGAFEEFERIFVKKDIPDQIDDFEIESNESELNILEILVSTKLAPSKKEARRLIEQGGVYIDNNRIDDSFANINLAEKRLFKVGKRKFLNIIRK